MAYEKRGVIFGCTAMICTILVVLGLVLPFATIDDDAKGQHTAASHSVWMWCTEVWGPTAGYHSRTCTDAPDCLAGIQLGARAFTSLSLVLLLMCMVVAVLDLLNYLPKKNCKYIYLAIAFFSGITLLLSFGTVTALYYNNCDGTPVKDKGGASLGGSPICIVTAAVFIFAAGVMAYIAPPNKILETHPPAADYVQFDSIAEASLGSRRGNRRFGASKELKDRSLLSTKPEAAG
jgi:hypothetical protein